MNESLPQLKVRIVLVNGWIFEKMAKRLQEHLPKWNIIAEIGKDPSPNADINHWMEYLDHRTELYRNPSVYITHVDYNCKLYLLKHFMRRARVGICMSKMMVDELVEAGVAREKLCFILAGHDGNIQPRRINIGITTRLYSDGRKREHLLVEAAKRMSMEGFRFDIMGADWEPVIRVLEEAGAEVRYRQMALNCDAGYQEYCERVKQFDYYLYLGMDEGSMGVLDAMSAGVPCILTPQGYHLDIPDAIAFSVVTTEDLVHVLTTIENERKRRVEAVQDLTWEKFAEAHAAIWREMINNPNADLSQVVKYPKPDLSEQVTEQVKGIHLLCNGNPIGDTRGFAFNMFHRTHFGKSITETWWFNLARKIKHGLVSMRRK